jgi:hypothetical protein
MAKIETVELRVGCFGTNASSCYGIAGFYTTKACKKEL